MTLTPEQFTQALAAASVQHHYTLTGAQDWPLLQFVAGIIGGLLLVLNGLVAMMWRWMVRTLGRYQDIARADLHAHKEDDEREHDAIWNEIRRCQSDCCPPRERR